MELRHQSIHAFMARCIMKHWGKFTFILQLYFLVFGNVTAIAWRIQWTSNAQFTPPRGSCNYVYTYWFMCNRVKPVCHISKFFIVTLYTTYCARTESPSRITSIGPSARQELCWCQWSRIYFLLQV